MNCQLAKKSNRIGGPTNLKALWLHDNARPGGNFALTVHQVNYKLWNLF